MKTKSVILKREYRRDRGIIRDKIIIGRKENKIRHDVLKKSCNLSNTIYKGIKRNNPVVRSSTIAGENILKLGK